MAHLPGAMSRWAALALTVAAVCGFLFVAAAVTSDGSDLRPAGGDLNSVLSDRTSEVEAKRRIAADLEQEIAGLSDDSDDVALRRERRRAEQVATSAGLTALQGPGMRVTLDDAPRSADFPGVDPNLLVVHQQDLQGFVNALWAGGAEAITLQGQRLVTTTGIKCVGNTVVLDGVPYAPPYVIEAIGSSSRLQAALDESPEVQIYGQYADKYGLVNQQQVRTSITAAAYNGSVSLRYATAIDQ